jgi:hypothetical protein
VNWDGLRAEPLAVANRELAMWVVSDQRSIASVIKSYPFRVGEALWADFEQNEI